jgi:N-acetyl-anhydromuramoyl-L-alanine amidase
MSNVTNWIPFATQIRSPHYDERESCPTNVDLLVIHNISLPPATKEEEFCNDFVEDFFQGKLDTSQHSFFEEIADLKVSSHIYIKRTGELIQFVDLNKRAWHAGVSEYQGRSKCNDFSIGIELQGTDYMPFTEHQYETLVQVTQYLKKCFPKIQDNIVGHSDIAPGRKTDPGEHFDWNHYFSQL